MAAPLTSLAVSRKGLWKFVAYGDVAAAMNALPRSGETLNGAWTRQDLLYDSDTEALSVNPLCISKKDSECACRPVPSLQARDQRDPSCTTCVVLTPLVNGSLVFT